MATKHVDDAKIAAEEHTIKAFMHALEYEFGQGEIEVTWHNFNNCGVRHERLMIGDKYVGYSMDQIEFINGLTTIDGEESTGTTDYTVSSQALAKRFLSVLMTVAFALLTRVDVCVFVTYLQRHTTSPTHGHIRALNTVARWMKNIHSS